MKIALIIPAAGSGTRLQSSLPKVLSPVNGRPMLHYIFQAYRDYVSRIVVVVKPSFEKDVQAYVEGQEIPVEIARQESPTGMLDAILNAKPFLSGWEPDRIWITWCDQIAVHPQTVLNLYEMSRHPKQYDLVFPTVHMNKPYIHLDRNSRGEIMNILHERECDIMPDRGESDMGLFSLSSHAYHNLLESFSKQVMQGATTKERNFLPFIPWVQTHGTMKSFSACHPMEALGVNTPEDLKKMEHYLRTQMSDS